jgi:hypothetical protein
VSNFYLALQISNLLSGFNLNPFTTPGRLVPKAQFTGSLYY